MVPVLPSGKKILIFDGKEPLDRFRTNFTRTGRREQRWNGGLGRAVILHDRDGNEGLGRQRAEDAELRLRWTNRFRQAYSFSGSGGLVSWAYLHSFLLCHPCTIAYDKPPHTWSIAHWY